MPRTPGLAEKLWAGFWYTRAQCLQNETTLFDALLRDKARPRSAPPDRSVGLGARTPSVAALSLRVSRVSPPLPRSHPHTSQDVAWRSDDIPVDASDAQDVVHSVSVHAPGPSSARRAPAELVMVHGFANGGGCFWPRVAAHGARGRTHLVDWRGAGMSGRPARFAPRTEAEAIEYLVDGLEAWRRAKLGEDGSLGCLLGHSMGAIVAAEYAAKHPNRVSHLVLVGPAAVKEMDPKRLETFLSRSWRNRLAFAAASGAWNSGVTPQRVMRALPFAWPRAIVEGYMRRRWRAKERLDAETFEALVEYATGVCVMRGVSERAMSLILAPVGAARTPIGPGVEALPENIAVTFVYGEHDWMDPAAGAEVVERLKRRGRRNVECHIVKDAGHYPFIDQPEEVFQIVEKARASCR